MVCVPAPAMASLSTSLLGTRSHGFGIGGLGREPRRCSSRRVAIRSEGWPARLLLVVILSFVHNQVSSCCLDVSRCSPLQQQQTTPSSSFGASPSSIDGSMQMCRAATTETATAGELTQFSSQAQAKVLAIVGAGSISPFDGNSWEEVMQHMAQRIGWIDIKLEMVVIIAESLLTTTSSDTLNADIAVLISITDATTASHLQTHHLQNIPTVVSFDCTDTFPTRLGGLNLSPASTADKLLATLPGVGTKRKEALKVLNLITEAWSRKSSDDVRFVLLVLIDSYVTPVTLLKNLRATSLASVQCMVKNCRSQILACVLDPDCRTALSCLQNCAPTDQVCSYRCIVSYESPKLEAFTLCVLQKHNCLGLSAEILMQPDVQPMAMFRGEEVTHEIAEDLFIGWLGRENGGGEKCEYSWRVVAGQNAAYDQFPCQYQMFYRGKAKGSVWYDPVFQVQSLDGRMVWRRRHYRVKRDKVPGTFYFTVLDNGVISKEFWRIVDVKDDFSWGLFYYSGAAAAAGQSYTGAILVTQDGNWPPESEAARLNAALDRCGIKVWELYRVNNKGCSGPPLGIPVGSSLHSVIT